MGKKNAVSGRHLHPVGQDDPFGTWVKTSLSQQFADVTAEPIPDKLLEILLFSPEVGDNPLSATKHRQLAGHASTISDEK
ncbi:hypothetical protein FMA36_11515 [Komagataeibacter xylinus]|uniref:Uncharacterized protein n=1 Tax=Komagataeibacter xylinus TaxID=28448 RepID=A0A857FPD7_KOMXY|nr:hypothetical protein FMA36_11515 [Komagataeibacter xylinus]